MKKKSSEPSNSTLKARKKEGEIPSTVQTTAPANKLAEQRELLRGILDDKELLELAVDGILIGSHDGIIIGANSYMQQLTGRTLDKLIGAHISTLFNTEELTKNPLRFDLLHKGEVVLSERNIVRPDGKIVPIEMRTKMMPNGTYQSIYRDITERKTAEKALKESEEKYRKTFYTSPDSIIITRLEDGKCVSINAGFTKIMGYTEHDIIGTTTLGLNIWVDPEERGRLTKGLMKDGFVENLESRFRKKNGEICFGLVSVSPLELAGVPHLISVTRDITERKKVEESIKKINRLYVVLSNANQAIVRIKEKEQLFNETCRVAVDDGKFVMAWIGMVNPSTNKVDVVGSSGVIKDYLDKINIDLNDKDRSGGIVGQAIKKQTHIIANDIKNDNFMSPWKEEAIKNGYKSAAAFPLTINGKVIGSFALYASEVNFFDEDEIKLLDELTMDISFALEVNQHEAERKQAEEELRKKEDQMRLLVEGTPYLFFYTQNINAEITYISPSVEKITGHPVEEWYNQTHWFVTNNKINEIAKEKTHAHLLGELTNSSILLEVKHADNHPILLEIFENPIILNGKVVGLQGVAHNITEQKFIEQKLKESEELFRNLVENITDVFYTVDGQGIMKYCSPNFFTLTGFLPQEILGHHYVRIIAPIDRRQVVEHYSNEIKRGVLDTNLEVRVERKDGKIHWIEQNTRIVRDEKGNVLEYRNVARDITERKQAEDALRKSEEWFRNLFEKASDGIFHLSLSGKIVSVNRSFARMHGYTVEEMLKINLKDLDTPEGSQLFPERICKILAGENLTFEVEHYHKNGHLFPLEVTASMVTVGDEKFIMAFHRDITERKQSEDALRASEERFRLISNLTSDYIFSTKITTDGKIESDWVMGAFEKITGYTIEEYKSIGGWLAVLHPDDREKDFLDFQKLLNNEKVISEVRTYHKNGNIVWNRTYASPIWDDKAKKVIGIYGAVQDITEKKYAEELINESEKKFRKIAEGTKAILFNTSVRGQLTYANQAASEALGLENKDLLGKFYLSFVHPDDRTKVHSYFLSQLKKYERDRSIDFRYLNATGKVGWLSFLVNLLYIDGKLAGFTGVAQEITERKQTEEALRKSELHFRSVWENAASGMRLTNEEGMIIAVNNAFCQIVGKTKEELEGFHLSVVYSSQNSLSIQQKHQERFKTRTVSPLVEKEFILWNDKKVWLRVVNSFIESEYEKPLLLGVFTDITEQKIAEGEIKKLSQAVEQSAGAIVITDLVGNIEYVNKKFEETTGYTFEEVKGQNPRILKSGETPLEEYKKMWECIFAGSEWRGTFHNKRKDGSLYWEATTISPIKNNEGKITNFLAIKDDITQDKLKEEMLKQSELHFRTVWESSIDGIRLTDEHGTIISVNNAFAKLFEKDKNEIIGKSFADVYGLDSGFNDVASFVHHFRERTIQPFMERDITLWNGKPMSIELTNSFVEIEGQPPLLLSIFRNVTENKQAEREIIIAKEKAEEANKVKTNFLENMSHELRTPMIPILGFTELMIGMDLPDEVKSMAVMMNKGGNRLMETLNIILDLAQIEKERVIIKPTKFNLLQIIDEVCGMFQPIAKGRNLYLKKELQTDTLIITSDERMLRHAVNNLINNGLKFTNKGGVTVKASLEKTENGNFAVIQICDTGIGIPQDQQDIIWEEFRQASEGIGRSFEGNGLGLTITKNFIEKLNGKVSVESEVGKGSTFTIKLPMDNNSDIKEILVKKENGISEQSAQHPLDFGEIQKAKEEPVKPNQLRKVLYVEDEEISFSVVNHFLKNVVSLDWAKSGQEGVVMARGNKYEAILMDINLAKGIDGMQTTKLIREMLQYQQTPIIAITAYAMRGAKEEFLGAGCSHYISKPFTKTALLQLMEEVLEKKVE